MWQTLLIQFGLMMLVKALAKSNNQPEPTALENQIITATSNEQILAAVVSNAITTLDPLAATVVEGLVKAKSKEEIAAVVNRPEVKMGLFDAIFNGLSNLFGGKN